MTMQNNGIGHGLPEDVRMALGLVYGAKVINKFGRNPDVDTGTIPEDIWLAGGEYTGTPTTGADTVSLASTSAADTAAGTGARTVMISGLDENWMEQEETLTLNGITNVVSALSWQRVNRATILTAGSGDTSAGDLSVFATTITANIFVFMSAGTGQSAICCYTIPEGYVGVLKRFYVSLRRGGSGTLNREADLSVQARDFGAPWRGVRLFQAQAQATLDRELFGGVVFAARTDIKMRCATLSASSTDIAGGFDIALWRQ